MQAITQKPTTNTRKAWVGLPAVPEAIDATKARPTRRTARQPIEASTLPDALLKMPTVNAITGLSSATIYRKVAAGEFPEPIRLGARCTRWPAAAVRAWLAARSKG